MLKPITKKAQAGFGVLVPIIIIVMISGIILAILGQVTDTLSTQFADNSSADNASEKVGGAVSDFAGNFGTFFSLALLVIILAIVGVFLFNRATQR